MVEESTIPLLNAQQLGMANLAHGALLMPELSLATTRQLALNLLREESRQVHKPDAGQKSSLVDEENGGGNAHAEAQFYRRPPMDVEEAEEEAPPASEKPLVGNLLNVKV